MTRRACVAGAVVLAAAWAGGCGGDDAALFQVTTTTTTTATTTLTDGGAGGVGGGGASGGGFGGAAGPSCGNGVLDLQDDEQCDDGNNDPGDGCGPDCKLEPVGQTCGDGKKDPGEVCDDANAVNGDGCNPTCNFAGTTSVFVGSPGQPGTLDGVGQAARIGGIGNLAVNATHLFLADGQNRTIRRIEIASATVQTVAGKISAGMGHNDADGLAAVFGSVEAITTDGSTVWIADAYNKVIRAMTAAPPYTVTTVAGSVGMQGHVDGVGNAARLDGIRGLTYYGGLVYFLDGSQSTLRRLDPKDGSVLTLAGQPGVPGKVDGFGTMARFISPRYMASDAKGRLYIADTNGNQIRAYDTATTEVTTFAGSGSCGYVDAQGKQAAIHRPRGMTSDGTSVYWVEFNAHSVRQATIAGANVTTFLGTFAACTATCSCGSPPNGAYAEGTGTAALFDHPFDMAYHFPSRSIFIVDGGNNVIRRVQ